MKQSELRKTIDALWRMESARLIAVLARMTRDVGTAEEVAQDAFLAAMEQWPTDGMPDNPAAWLMSAAKHRAIDRLRRVKRIDRKHAEIGRDMDFERQDNLDARLDDHVGDDLLRLIFTICHPVLSTEARVALALRLLGGLTTDEIARGFLVSEATIAQRIVRAKKTLNEKQVAIEMPRPVELKDRLASVLEVIYLIFNEGYTATAGSDWMRPTLCEEALRLGRILMGLMPSEGEVLGLVALMEIQASRLRARTNRLGEPVLLMDQDRAKWDHLLIRRGLDALDRLAKLNQPRGSYALQGEIAACHARARTADQTDWAQIARWYEELVELTQSPVVELNRAVAVSMAQGPAAGLEIVDHLKREKVLDGYHLLPSVRGDLLVKLGRLREARAEFESAARLTRNDRERELLLSRAKSCE